MLWFYFLLIYLQLIILHSEEELLKSKQSQTTLMNQLADAVKSQNSQAAQKSSQSNELQEAKARITELMNQISGLKSDKEKLKTEQQQYKDRIEEYTTQLENISKKNEVCFTRGA